MCWVFFGFVVVGVSSFPLSLIFLFTVQSLVSPSAEGRVDGEREEEREREWEGS